MPCAGDNIRIPHAQRSDEKRARVKKQQAAANTSTPAQAINRLKTNRGITTNFPVVAVGASAGGLEAFTQFLQAFPSTTGMAFIFVQHLDPAHASMMVELLSAHTKMSVQEAVDGAHIKRNTVYIIAPGTYLAARSGVLCASTPQERRGARMPFDFLLRSLAETYGELAVGIVLSGNGTDGSLGLKAIKDSGGLVIAQDPDEAANTGMPQSAIGAGAVDLILPIARMPDSLAAYIQQIQAAPERESLGNAEAALTQIIDTLRSQAAHDFAGYKPGTLMRRIRRRMALHGIEVIEAYAAFLPNNTKEIDALAKDLLIHVTGFFRDTAVFDFLSTTIIPQLVREHPPGQSLRVWVPACSSGEEVYSLAMLFLEEIAAVKKNIKLQIFGSDIDEHAVAAARSGIYPASLETEISPERLARFFIKDTDNYRIAPSLREAVIFTVQDVLTDPPFARIDLVSCRNLLIYLLPDIQQHVLSLLHFALRKDGILLLGIAESTGSFGDDLDPISSELRVFRRAGIARKNMLKFGYQEPPRAFWPRPVQNAPAREINLGEISRKILLETYAPASVLINQKNECLYYYGSTESYLQIPTGDASQGLLAMVRQGLRNKLRTALQRAHNESATIAIAAGTIKKDDVSTPVRIEVRPVQGVGKELFLVSFMDEPQPQREPAEPGHTDFPQDLSRNRELEKLVEALQLEIQNAARELEISSADQEAINEEAQSLNEEHQSTNEELETSKEELQSLNEELTALNAQLTATVNQQRNTADDLDNILRCSELAIVFLDPDLKIRFFSPAAKALLKTIASDLGRPIDDLAHRFDDADLLIDVRSVLKAPHPISREVRSHNGAWYSRHILPYRTQAGIMQGVVVTFSDISVMKAAELKIEAERAYAGSVIDTVRQPLVVVDDKLRIVSCNSSFRGVCTATTGDLAGQAITAVGGRLLDIPAMNIFLDRSQAETAPLNDYEIELDLPEYGHRIYQLSSRRIPDVIGVGRRILIAFDDITDRRAATEALEVAKQKAEKANLGKSRFLAAASHDLRQPLQTLSLLHGILARKITDTETLGLIGKLNETLGAMSGMLDTLLDINQLEAGTVQPEIDNFAISTVLEQLQTEFTYLVKSKGLELRVMPSTLRVRSDPLLLAQMIRNLLSNAIKYTKYGRVTFGCRRVGNKVRLEVWDTGIGIPAGQLKAIFEEYHQLGNPARERGLGLGLGLSIVHRIGELLGHRVEVRSQAGKGSVFIIEVARGDDLEKQHRHAARSARKSDKPARRGGSVLVVEDDPTVREALALLFRDEGYHITAAADGMEVSALLKQGRLMPDVVIADYNLPGGRNGLDVIKNLRTTLNRAVPAIILTGDIATDVLRKVVAADCGYLHKPVNVDQLTRRVDDLVAAAARAESRKSTHRTPGKTPDHKGPTVFLVDDDEVLRESMRDMLQEQNYAVETYASAEAFLSAYAPDRRGCLVVDSVMPGMNGLELLQRLKAENHSLPSIVITGYGDIPMAIKAMKVGAMDFIEKPARSEDLTSSIDNALAQANDANNRSVAQNAAAASIALLTKRERAVMNLVVGGQSNKLIAHNLNISQRTVETHRASVMKRTASASLADLIRLVMRSG